MIKPLDSDAYMTECEALADDWTREDVRDLYDFLSSEFGKKIVCVIILTAKSQVWAAGECDLTSEEGVKHALQLQGLGRGLGLAVETLLDLVNEEVALHEKEKETDK